MLLKSWDVKDLNQPNNALQVEEELEI